MSAQLELKHINKNFGGLRVINDLTFTAQPGQITGLIGPNGAGKTTLLNLISGIYQPDSGDILLDGRSLVGLESHQVTQRGIARTFQTLRLFLNMSIIENVISASFSRAEINLFDIVFRTPRFRREELRLRQEAEDKLAFFGTRLVGYRFDQPAYSLSYANRRRLEIARAMMTNPRILLLDEPAAGMNPNETLEMTELIGKLRDEAGYTIVLIEHDMNVVGGICDHVIVLDHGEKIAEGDFEDVVADERVVEAYLGRKSS